MRICYISYKFYPAIGGAEKRAEKQAHQLQSLGHEVTIITLRLERNLKRFELLDGLPVTRIGGLYRRNGRLRLGKYGQIPIGIGMLLALWQRRHQYDIIHALQIGPPSVLAALFSHFIHKPIVLSMQNTGPYESQLAPLKRMKDGTLINSYGLQIDQKDDLAMHSSDLTLLPRVLLGGHLFLKFLRKSHAFFQALSTRSYSYLLVQEFPSERTIVIPGSVDTEKFCPAQKKTLEYTTAERNIICVARLEYEKGIDILLHAWAKMMQAISERKNELKPTLHLVGDGRLRRQLECMATELGIQNSVQFLGNRSDIVLLLQQSWGFVLPSRWEGMPNALLEAMSVGLPCIASRVSGSEDLIINDINGLLVEPEQPTELFQALCRIIEDTDLVQRLGTAARTTILQNYQLTNVVNQLVELYRRLLSKKPDVVLK